MQALSRTVSKGLCRVPNRMPITNDVMIVTTVLATRTLPIQTPDILKQNI
eukprot:NODE_31851_length_388_cov_2.586207.p5 GENE.NODE_31851_length_388_cov_2.586207~~NODE_31851_length_388_cov_2.586207.p5  ORF type:complete len:50 (+),score=2.99 NODE_31851_length_388_cov_2.586207:234-383(+)